MAQPTAFILVVGLNQQMLEHAPRLRSFAGGRIRTLQPPLPAVTCTVQSSMFTGLPPSQHGIVGNGWYNRELAEVQFWKQSNHLVRGEKVWETARRRDASITCLNMFCWYNMYSSVDYSCTPRPQYKADGRKIPDCYTHPPELRDELQEKFGQFPLFHFWGPASSIKSSAWIVDATMYAHAKYNPTLTLVYLPHLDYALQKFGPDDRKIPQHVAEIDAEAGRLIDYFLERGVQPIVAGEYGIEKVEDAVPINRYLREAGAVRVRLEGEGELLDPGASDAFAVADHQIAHVYVKDPSKVERITAICREVPGVDQVLTRADQERLGLAHERSGELVLVSAHDRWFSHDYWLSVSRIPDFARTVEIHRKPGYDPRELFIDPAIAFPKFAIGWRLLKKALGMRVLMDVIALDASLVRGSHGRTDLPVKQRPILLAPHDRSNRPDEIPATAVRDLILEHLLPI